MACSSSGLGHRLLRPKTRVRLPYTLPTKDLMQISCWDVDNTLVRSHDYYDEGYRQASRKFFGPKNEFVMTRRPDGSPERDFSKLTTSELLERRLHELGIDSSQVDPVEFYRVLSEFAKDFVKKEEIYVYPGVEEVLAGMGERGKNIIITSGPRELQLVVLETTGLREHFNLGQSYFFGDYINKRQVLEKILQEPETESVVFFGDAPSEMAAVKQASYPEGKYGIAVGVTVEGLSTAEELKAAGADEIIQAYSPEVLRELDIIDERFREGRLGDRGPERI